jgi:hypothetical protein
MRTTIEEAMKWICSMAGVFRMLAYATLAQAVAFGECRVPLGVVKVTLPAGLPPALSKAMGDVALPGEPFDAGDVYFKRHKHSRYIFVWNIGSRWIVATEEGGKVLRAAIVAYDLGTDGKTATVIDERTTSPTNFCGAATKLTGR